MNGPLSSPGDRKSTPDSLTAIGARLDDIDRGQREISEKLGRLLLATYDATNEALIVKQQNVTLNSELAKARNRIEALELWGDQMEARVRALEALGDPPAA